MEDASEFTLSGSELFEGIANRHNDIALPWDLDIIQSKITIREHDKVWDVQLLGVSRNHFVLIATCPDT